MAALMLDQTYAVLERMNQSGGSAIATHWMAAAAGCPGDTARTRRLLAKMRAVGLIDGVEASRSGRVFWWKITDAGRQFLVTFAARMKAATNTDPQTGTKDRNAGRSETQSGSSNEEVRG